MAIEDANVRVIAGRRYVLTRGAAKPVTPERAESKLTGTVADLVYSEFKAEFLPYRDYRRGTGDTDVIPPEWEGMSFASSFSIGGPDMEMMGLLAKWLKDGGRLVVPANGGNHPDVDGIFLAIQKRSEEDEKERAEQTYSLINGVHASNDYPCWVEASMPRPEIVEGRPVGGLCIMFDLYSGGVISASPEVPDMSSRFYADVSDRPITYGYGDGAIRTRLKWGYDIYVHASKPTARAKYPSLPKDGTVKRGFSMLQGTVSRLLNEL